MEKYFYCRIWLQSVDKDSITLLTAKELPTLLCFQHYIFVHTPNNNAGLIIQINTMCMRHELEYDLRGGVRFSTVLPLMAAQSAHVHPGANA